MQPFENELCRRYLLLGILFLRNAERSELVHQSLDSFQLFQSFHSRHRIRQLNLSAQVEPLHNLLHIRARVILVVGLRNRGTNQLAPHEVRALHFAFVFQFKLAGNRRQSCVHVADARHNHFFVVANRASLRV